MNVYRPIIFLLLCISVLFSSCNKDEENLGAHYPPCSSSGSDGYFFPSLIPNLRTYPFAVRMSEIEEEPQGHRVPPGAIRCLIDLHEGVQIKSVNSEDILCYEVYTEDGVCEETFTDEQEFVSFIYSLSGFHIVNFITSDNYLAGYIEGLTRACQDLSEISDNSDEVLVIALYKLNN